MKNNIEEMHKQMFELVNQLRKEGNDPLAIAGCMLAGAVQIYQVELGDDTAFRLLDQIANGDDDIDIDLDVDKETIHWYTMCIRRLYYGIDASILYTHKPQW